MTSEAQELLDEAAEAATQATAFDNGKSYAAAIYYYKHTATLLTKAIQHGLHSATIDDKISQYLQRAEDLQQQSGLLIYFSIFLSEKTNV